MDHWISDDNIFISRKSGTSDGVVQVYKYILPDLPLGEYSFSLIGEADTPSAIAPSVTWDHSAYLRLIEFLEYNSAMVTASGHVVMRSQIRIGGRDGPTTYWRCLDLMPMHVFGLIKPVDTGLKPRFLIVGGDVEIAPANDWKSKYETLYTAYNTLMTGSNELNGKWTKCKLENDRLVKDSEAYKKLKDGVQDMIDERDRMIREAKESNDIISNIRDQLKNSITKSVLDDLLKTENDRWCMGICYRSLEDRTKYSQYKFPNDSYVRVDNLSIGSIPLNDYAHYVGEFYMYGTWKMYRNGRTLFFHL